jgi:predicted Zn-dependent protease
MEMEDRQERHFERQMQQQSDMMQMMMMVMMGGQGEALKSLETMTRIWVRKGNNSVIS